MNKALANKLEQVRLRDASKVPRVAVPLLYLVRTEWELFEKRQLDKHHLRYGSYRLVRSISEMLDRLGWCRVMGRNAFPILKGLYLTQSMRTPAQHRDKDGHMTQTTNATLWCLQMLLFRFVCALATHAVQHPEDSDTWGPYAVLDTTTDGAAKLQIWVWFCTLVLRAAQEVEPYIGIRDMATFVATCAGVTTGRAVHCMNSQVIRFFTANFDTNVIHNVGFQVPTPSNTSIRLEQAQHDDERETEDAQ
jgi:hypothetical protein